MSHASSLVRALRSVALYVPDLEKAEQFYTHVWHLQVVARTGNAIYFTGAGQDHHLLSLHQRDGETGIRHVTLRARDLKALDEVARRAVNAGGQVVSDVAPCEEPGGGTALVVADRDGRRFQLVCGDERVEGRLSDPDQPIRLAHVVLNCHNVDETQRFMEAVLDFSLSDRTRIMAFMRCNSDHHTIALGDTDNDALNHIAFLMPDLDSVMRGGGRMRDAGYEIAWGPGRHGPGNNAFNYFIGPFGEVIEYTAEVEQIDDNYPVGSPSDWIWPSGRIDQWGISVIPAASLKQAQRSLFFSTHP